MTTTTNKTSQALYAFRHSNTNSLHHSFIMISIIIIIISTHWSRFFSGSGNRWNLTGLPVLSSILLFLLTQFIALQKVDPFGLGLYFDFFFPSGSSGPSIVIWHLEYSQNSLKNVSSGRVSFTDKSTRWRLKPTPKMADPSDTEARPRPAEAREEVSV